MDSGVVVSNDREGSGDDERRGLSYGHIPLAKLEDADPESYEALVELLSKVGDNIIGKFLSKDWSKSGVYIQNVITFDDDRERDILHSYLLKQGESFKRDLYGFSFDDDHVHIIHSCAFSSSQCKCRWRKEIPCGTIKPGYRFRSNLREWGRNNFINAVLYFFYKKWGRKEAWINGRSQRLEDKLKSVRWGDVEASIGGILRSSNSQTGLDIQPLESDDDISESVYKRRKRAHEFIEGSQKNKKSKESKWQIISRKIQQLLEDTAICPLEGIKSEECFLNDDWLTDPDNSTKVNKAIEVWSYKINKYTLRDFFNMYSTKCSFQNMVKPSTNLFARAFAILSDKFNSSDVNILMQHMPKPNIEEPIRDGYKNLIFSRSKTYYPMEESREVLVRLLKYQFDDDEALIKNFLQSLVNVLDWQPDSHPGSNIKCNAFLVYSPASAGKNFFFDTVFTLLLNLGQLGTANKSNNFAFQDAANRRVILWNEPNYESSCTDYLKTLFEGGDTKVRVKMMGDSHIKRTPIVILTNNSVNFMDDIAFKDRIKQFRWKAAPFLKEYKLKPYPLVFFDILLKYEIKF